MPSHVRRYLDKVLLVAPVACASIFAVQGVKRSLWDQGPGVGWELRFLSFAGSTEGGQASGRCIGCGWKAASGPCDAPLRPFNTGFCDCALHH